MRKWKWRDGWREGGERTRLGDELGRREAHGEYSFPASFHIAHKGCVLRGRKGERMTRSEQRCQRTSGTRKAAERVWPHFGGATRTHTVTVLYRRNEMLSRWPTWVRSRAKCSLLLILEATGTFAEVPVTERLENDHRAFGRRNGRQRGRKRARVLAAALVSEFDYNE